MSCNGNLPCTAMHQEDISFNDMELQDNSYCVPAEGCRVPLSESPNVAISGSPAPSGNSLAGDIPAQSDKPKTQRRSYG